MEYFLIAFIICYLLLNLYTTVSVSPSNRYVSLIDPVHLIEQYKGDVYTKNISEGQLLGLPITILIPPTYSGAEVVEYERYLKLTTKIKTVLCEKITIQKNDVLYYYNNGAINEILFQ